MLANIALSVLDEPSEPVNARIQSQPSVAAAG